MRGMIIYKTTSAGTGYRVRGTGTAASTRMKVGRGPRRDPLRAPDTKRTNVRAVAEAYITFTILLPANAGVARPGCVNLMATYIDVRAPGEQPNDVTLHAGSPGGGCAGARIGARVLFCPHGADGVATRPGSAGDAARD